MDIERFLQDERLPAGYAAVVEHVHRPLAVRMHKQALARGHFVVGLCGAQGSGKSTMARSLWALLESQGLSCAVVSLDDLYLTRTEREALAERAHPLLITRGVPGTHDVRLGIETLEALKRPGEVALPRFDKSSDDRRPIDAWPRVQAPVQVVLFEGWCVGAAPQDDAALARPVNSLECEQDPDGRWRRFVNDALRTDYQALFALLDMLILLQAPSFDVVYAWRLEQERKLREREERPGSRIMNEAEIARFIAHYERLTRHILEEMPRRADVVLRLNEEREPVL